MQWVPPSIFLWPTDLAHFWADSWEGYTVELTLDNFLKTEACLSSLHVLNSLPLVILPFLEQTLLK